MGQLNQRQLDVLHWIGDGCPDRDWPDQSHKLTARSLAGRGLADVRRKKKIWTATITAAGQYYLDHGKPPPSQLIRDIVSGPSDGWTGWPGLVGDLPGYYRLVPVVPDRVLNRC